MQTPMAQLSLRIRAVWSAPLLLALWTVQQLNFYFLLLLFISEKIHIINIDEHAYIKNSIQHCDGIAFLYKIYAVSKYTFRSQWYAQGEINSLRSALNSKIYDQHLLSLRAVGSFYCVH